MVRRGRLTLLKIRQPPGTTLRYVEAFRDRPTVFLASQDQKPGLPLVVTEGEFDTLLLGQELAGLAVVATLGPASIRPESSTLSRFLGLTPWYIATDADQAGDLAAAAWSGTTRRVRPPGSCNDWTEASQAGVDLRRWWGERLAGRESPDLFTWDELAAWRWGPAVGDSEPGIGC